MHLCSLGLQFWCKIKTLLQLSESQLLSYIIAHFAFQSGTFKGSQLNWVTLIKEAYAIYMAFCKFLYYVEGSRVIIWCDHAPLKKFLEGRMLNNKVNNWGIELSYFQIDFQYIKGKRNVMADALHKLKKLGSYKPQNPEAEGK